MIETNGLPINNVCVPNKILNFKRENLKPSLYMHQ